MGIDPKAIANNIKNVVFSIRVCFGFVYKHPLFLVIAIVALLLNRFLPSVFDFFISSSPVIICTALLLGALLSFGNVCEVGGEADKTDRLTSSMKTENVADDLVVRKGDNSGVGTDIRRRREAGERAIKEVGPVEGGEAGGERKDDGERKVGGEREHGGREFVEKREFYEEKTVGKILEGGGRAEGDFVDRKNVDHKPSSGILDAHLVDHHDSSDSDSDSDRTESSSPDASVADIRSMLDELDPLLDTEVPQQPTLASCHDSVASSRCSSSSHGSDSAIGEVVEDAENHDDEEEEEQEEEAQEDQEDGTTAVVSWTADDEKNLIDVKKSELERNQRLENLIAKRIARKNQRDAATEKNLIDLDSNDTGTSIGDQFSHIQIQVPSLSTTKHNPFDLPYSPIPGLPPIPGSAPSILLPRRNPFDLPYGPPGVSGNLTSTGSSQQQFVSIPQREMFFRRHESFTLGASFPMEIKQERLHDSKLRPYFVPERAASSSEDGHSTLQRQLSGVSDSKASSVLDSDAISSVVDHEEDHEDTLEQGSNQQVQSTPHIEQEENESSEEAESLEMEQDQSDVDVGVVHETVSNASDAIDEKYEGGSSSSLSIQSEQTEAGDSSKASIGPVRLVRDEMEGIDEGPIEEPVYDSSPSAVAKSLSSVSAIEDESAEVSDGNIGILKGSSPPIPGDGIAGEAITSLNEEPWVASSILSTVDRSESRSREVTEVNEADVIQVVFESSTDTEPTDIHVVGCQSSSDGKIDAGIPIEESASGPSFEGGNKESQRKPTDETSNGDLETKEITQSSTTLETKSENSGNESAAEVIDSNKGGIQENLHDLEEAKEEGVKETNKELHANEGEVEKSVLLESSDDMRPVLIDTQMGPSPPSLPDKQVHSEAAPIEINTDHKQVVQARLLPEDIEFVKQQPKSMDSEGRHDVNDIEASEGLVAPFILRRSAVEIEEALKQSVLNHELGIDTEAGSEKSKERVEEASGGSSL